MNNNISMPSSQRNYPDHKDLNNSLETEQLISLGDQYGWGFQVLGQAPFPEAPVRIGDWLLSPAQSDSSLIPARTLSRIQMIYAAGIRPQGFVVVHESPMLLPAPADGKGKKLNRIPFLKPAQNIMPSTETINDVFGAITKVISEIASMLVSFLSFVVPALLSSTLILGALLLDPILVAVTEDGIWIEVDRWNLPTE